VGESEETAAMQLSIVELATTAPGTTEADALADALATARHADALGFHRVWFAEHHASQSNASHHPEVLMSAAAAQTVGIRVGSGSVLLNHYSPFKVAEMFKQMEALFPGRVDLGMGRATGGPVVDAALRRDRSSRPVDDHHQQVTEVLAWLYERFPADHPFASTRIMPSVDHLPETWLLGSSPGGAGLAAGLGIGYTFAGFINPNAAAMALRNYRAAFRPMGFGLEQPRAMLGINVSVGDDDADARRLVASVKGFYARLSRGDYTSLVPAADVAEAEMTPAERDEPTRILDGRWPRFVAGGPDQVRATIEEMVAESGADEVIIQNMIADPDDRRASHARLAEMFGLTPRSSTRPGAHEEPPAA
jgi:luciferase family oxidoreductase group 1